MARTRCYQDGGLVLEDFPIPDISDHLEDPRSIVWLDLCQPTPEELAQIAEEFGLHSLAIEDALHRHERPKLDRYNSYLFLSAYAVRFEHGAELQADEIAVFVLDRAFITIRKTEGFDIEQVVQRWDSARQLCGEGVGFLLHGFLDVIIDGHFTAVQQLDEAIEDLEDILFNDRPETVETVQRQSFELRKTLVLLRRIVLPMREIVNTVMRQDIGVVSPVMLPYYRDAYDHVLRASEWTESLRDLVNSVLETNISVQGNRMNLVMKKVTSWAAIIAVPTAITGFYGQNLPYPGFGKASGLWWSVGLIVGIGALLYVAFRKWEWL